jgi:hypothetical protein
MDRIGAPDVNLPSVNMAVGDPLGSGHNPAVLSGGGISSSFGGGVGPDAIRVTVPARAVASVGRVRVGGA